jgi:hypothetical protein
MCCCNRYDVDSLSNVLAHYAIGGDMDSRHAESLLESLGGTTRRTALHGLGAGSLAGLRGMGGAHAAPAPSTFASWMQRLATAPASQSGTPMATAWRLSGDAMEACRCAVTCPCNFGSDPTDIPCGAIIGWHIADGEYGDIALNDLNLVAYLQIPGNAFQGNWALGYYFDERANPKQAEALGAIFSGKAGGWPAVLSALIATSFPPRQVPITFELADDNVRVTVPGYLEVATERVPNPLPGAPPLDLQVSNLAVPFYTGTVAVRRSTTLTLTDPNLSFRYPGRSSLIGAFDYRGP